MYQIYRISSPSGKSYIGLTKQGLRERWRQHVSRSKDRKENHPFYNAIRKYGAGAFTVCEIDTAPDKTSAQALEKQHIAMTPSAGLYNVSPGGEADGETGPRVFWDKIRNDPARLGGYLKKLSKTKTDNDWSNYDDMSRKALAWRKAHPREAYKASDRARRMARTAEPKPEAPHVDMKTRLMWKHRRRAMTRMHATEAWAKRTEGQKEVMSRKIGDGQKAYWSGITDAEERYKKTAAARAAIDRSKQGPAASAGLKKFWSDLRDDPERYQEFMAARRATRRRIAAEKRNR